MDDKAQIPADPASMTRLLVTIGYSAAEIIDGLMKI
jgi:hypothetical protein